MGRVIVGQEDVVHMHQDPGRKRGQNAAQQEIDVAARHQDVARVDHEELAGGQAGKRFEPGLLQRGPF